MKILIEVKLAKIGEALWRTLESLKGSLDILAEDCIILDYQVTLPGENRILIAFDDLEEEQASATQGDSADSKA